MAIDKNAVIKEAQKFAAKGQFDKAIAEWKKLLREFSSDPNIYNTIGDLCLKKDAKAEAVDAYRKAADILAEDGFTSKAIALYKKVLNIDPQKIEVYLALGNLNAEKGLTSAALENYKLIADHYTHQNDTVKALGIYQKMADLNPSNVAFRIKLGDMYVKAGMKTEAANAYLEAADAQVSKNAFQEARQLFEKILSLDPNSKEVYHKAGLVYFKEGKFVEACKALKPAFEKDPSNRELADVYLEALVKSDKHAEVEEVLVTLITADASRIDLREKLYHLYLGKQEYEKALQEASALALAKTEIGEVGAAEDILKAFVSGNPNSAPGREKLAEFYASNDRLENAAEELLQAARLYEEEGDQERYKAALSRAVEIAPGMPEAARLLKQLEASSSVIPPAASAPQVPEQPVSAPEIFAPEPDPMMSEPTPLASEPVAEENPAIDEAFTEADVLIKYGLPAKAAEQLEGVVEQYPENIRVRTKLRDLYHEQGNAEKTAHHSLLLSDIHAKQGNSDMASAELQLAHETDPDNPIVLARLGIAPAVPASIDTPPEIMQDHLEITTTSPQIPASAFEENPPILEPLEPIPSSDGGILFEGLETELPAPEEVSQPQEKNGVQPPSMDDISISEEEERVEMPPPIAADVSPSEVLQPLEMQEREPQQLEEEPPIMEQPPAAEVLEQPAPPEIDLSEIWAEAEFYYQQGLFEEARKHYTKIIELAPDDRRAIDRLAELSREENETREFTRLAEAVESLEDEAVADAGEGALAASESDEEAVRSLMKEIAEISKKQKPVPPPPKAPLPQAPRLAQTEEIKRGKEPPAPPTRRQEPPPKVKPIQTPQPFIPAAASARGPVEEDFFDLGAELQKEVSAAGRGEQKKKTEDFFDLASELRDEISNVRPTARTSGLADDQSLDDIFEEFKKGVEQQTIREDTDTHYNLGVAYKEMGLLDDAIAEFILTPEGESWFVESRYMLGLCYMEKGDYQNAISELQKAVKSHGIEDPDKIEMQYDLGLAYQGTGNIKAAIAEFQKVASVNPKYRDTTEKLNELRQGEFISLEQLKDDIEKEISAKFLQEGERIERKEKSKKAVKSSADRA